MGRKRLSETHLPQHLRVKRGARRDTYFTQLGGKYVGLGNDRSIAERKLRDLIAGKPVAGTIAELCERYLRWQEDLIAAKDKSALARRTLDDYADGLRDHVLPVFGKMLPAAFRPMHKAQYLDRQRLLGRPVRANREMAALSSAFNYGMRIGVIDENPCHGVRRNTETPRSRLPTTAEINALLGIAKAKGTSSYVVALLALAVAITGRRRAELLTLRLSDLSENGISGQDAKRKPGESARRFTIAWSPLLRQIIEGVRALERPPSITYLFPTMDGSAYTDSGFKTMWGRVMDDFVAQGGERFTAHDLRSYYVSEKKDRGEDPQTHANEATTARVYDRRKVRTIKPLA
jgi:integrase